MSNNPADPPPNPTPKKSGGGFGFVMLLSLVGIAWLAYENGWLNNYLPKGLTSNPQSVPVAPSQTKSAPAPTTVVTQAPAVAPVTVATTPIVVTTAPPLNQTEALIARMDVVERNLQDLSAIVEQIAAIASGATDEQNNGLLASSSTALQLRFELIDARLQLSGNISQAQFELEKLAAETPKGTILYGLIDENRRKLSAIPSREEIINRLIKTSQVAQSIITTIERDANEQDLQQQEQNGLLGKLFQVRKIDDKSPILPFARQVINNAENCLRSLTLNQQATYNASLNSMQQASISIGNSSVSVVGIELAKLIGELVRIGYPNYSLLKQQI